MKARIHEVIVKVRFDKPTSRAHAVATFKNNVHGTFYPCAFEDNDPETMRIKSVRSSPRRKS